MTPHIENDLISLPANAARQISGSLGCKYDYYRLPLLTVYGNVEAHTLRFFSALHSASVKQRVRRFCGSIAFLVRLED